jgi:hypothetical protein
MLWICSILLAACSEETQLRQVPLENADGAGIQQSVAVDYVTKLGLIQGHLWVAAQLVEAGLFELGAKHAKHPAQEVYQELRPFFLAVGSKVLPQNSRPCRVSLPLLPRQSFKCPIRRPWLR